MRRVAEAPNKAEMFSVKQGQAPRLLKGPSVLVGRPMQRLAKERLFTESPSKSSKKVLEDERRDPIPNSIGARLSQYDRTALVDAVEDHRARLWYIAEGPHLAVCAIASDPDYCYFVLPVTPTAEEQEIREQANVLQRAHQTSRETQLPYETLVDVARATGVM